MKQRRNSNLSAFLATFLAALLGSGGVWSLCASTEDKGPNEKLLTAIRDADAQAARALLSSPLGGADANARDEDGLTALMHAAMYAGADCEELLLEKGADPNAKSKSGVTALMLAIGQADKVRLLLAKGAYVNAKSKQGHTALTIAAGREGGAEVVKLLLNHGADLSDAKILCAAARSGDTQVIKLLLERDADPNGKSQIGGQPPVLVNRAGDLNQTGGTPVISPLLVLTGTIGSTPLMYAAMAGSDDVGKLLLGKGPAVSGKIIVNARSLKYGAQMGDHATVKLLLENGAEVNIRHESGYTALMYAAASESNDPELIRALLASGAEINVRAKDGETALKLAGRKGRTEIVRLLEKAGAKE